MFRQRHEPPRAYPAPGAVRLVYRIGTATELVPIPVLVERTGWTPAYVNNLRSGMHGSKDRHIIRSLEQTTLVKLLEVLRADHLSTLLPVEPTLTATAPAPHDPQEVVTIIGDPGLPWRAVVERWRQLGDLPADQIQASGLLGIDAAAIRYLYQHHLGVERNVPLRLGGQLAEVLQVTRSYVQLLVSGKHLAAYQPDALPEAVQRFLDQLLAGQPLSLATGDQ